MIQFYKPNKSVSGSACSFQYRDGSFYIEALKQSGWNEQTKKGSFKSSNENPAAKINAKFTLFEMGQIVSAINSNTDTKFYHTSANQTFQGNFGPYISKENVQIGYSLSLNKTAGDVKASIRIGFTFGEAEIIKAFIDWALKTHFTAEQRKQDAKRQAYQANQSAPNERNSQPQQQPEPKSEEIDFQTNVQQDDGDDNPLEGWGVGE